LRRTDLFLAQDYLIQNQPRHNNLSKGHASGFNMSGFLEVLGAISAALSVLKAARGIADWIDEYDEFDDDVDRAFQVVGLLKWRWTRLTQYLNEARHHGHDDRQLTAHANAVEGKLCKAYELVKDLQNRDKTTNMKVLLGFGPRNLKKLKMKVDDTANDLQSIEIVFLGFVLVYCYHESNALTVKDGAPRTCGEGCPAAVLCLCRLLRLCRLLHMTLRWEVL
jgi:hypothetical protein